MNQQKTIAMVVGSLAVIVILGVIVMMQPAHIITPANTNTNETLTENANINQPVPEQPTTMDTLKTETVKKGSGPAAQAGNEVTVHYTGTLDDGSKFDSSRDRGTPFTFTLGQHQVIEGWEQGVLGMQVGEERKLTIPSSLGYGDTGYPPVIPAKATLHFDIELLGIK